MKKLLLYLLFTPLILFAQRQPKVGLVLSGGGAKGFAHIGVLKELEKAGVQIDYIGGTSMGAIVGSLYATGYTANQIEAIVNKVNFNDMLQDNIERNAKPFFEKAYGEKYAISLPIKKDGLGLPLGLSKGQNVLNLLTELLAPVDEINSFEKLPIPFYCVATNIETSKAVVFEKGSLPLAIRASAAFPSLLNPVEINGKLLVDGGVVNNFPVDIMKNKDVDIIIGINVQGKLLNADELSSVASILLQIINFQMYKNADEQVKLLDINIRPSILDYSVISFDKKNEIIQEGINASKVYRRLFDSIAKRQIIKRKPVKLTLKEPCFLVDRIVIKGNKHYTRNYVLGKIKLIEGDSTSYKAISKKINTLTATGNFDRIDYHLEKSFQGKKLVIDLKEATIKQFVRLGLHYDLLYKTAVQLGYNHKHLLFQNDEFLFELAVGDRVRYHLEYFIDNGIVPSFGFSSRYNSFKNTFTFNQQVSNINIKYEDFSNRFFMQTGLNKKTAFGIGLAHKKIKISTETTLNSNGTETLFDDSNYVKTYAYLNYDSFDKVSFPTKGFFADIGFHWFLWSDRDENSSNLHQSSMQNFQQFSQLTGRLSFATSFWGKLTFQYTSDGGYTLGKKASPIFDFRLGGYNQNYINNFIPFYGYDVATLSNQSFLRSTFELRYELFTDQFASLTANYARVEENVLADGSLFANTKSGYALGYGVDTFLGPIALKYAWSPDHNKKFWLFNLGFWF